MTNPTRYILLPVLAVLVVMVGFSCARLVRNERDRWIADGAEDYAKSAEGQAVMREVADQAVAESPASIWVERVDRNWGKLLAALLAGGGDEAINMIGGPRCHSRPRGTFASASLKDPTTNCPLALMAVALTTAASVPVGRRIGAMFGEGQYNGTM